ncbi:MAG TPA: ABC transporter ATP-binding protein [Tepidisphaeraceae bacterium]|nr:ABC transporter ATP-binding protein [Tepidisphaeraceae bacterium]
MSQLLQAKNIGFAYGDRPVLRDVSISLEAGQIVTLLGPNGSGKSTLIKCLLGHLRCTGEIEWEGRRLSAWRRRAMARRVAYLPQSPVWEPEQTVLDVLRLGRSPYWRAFGIESSRDVRVVNEVSTLLGLEELHKRRMDEISGGQRQRVFIGRCLIQEPRAMLLDEPNTFLDLRHQVEVSQLLRRLARERSIGVIMASHDLNLAGSFADRMVLLQDGAAVITGTPSEVLQPELLSQVYGVKMERIDRDGGKMPVVVPDIQEPSDKA